MNPELEVPSVVLVLPRPYGEIEIGDIIVFDNAGTLVAHRAIRQDKKGRWITKGDNVDVEDKWPITAFDYRGVAVQ
jgi:signal peptidase I